MKVGYEKDSYAEQRLFLGTSPAGVSFTRVNSEGLDKLPSYFNRNEITNSSWVSDKNVDLVHYFNQVNFGDTPFVTTFETVAPRFWNEKSYSLGADILASEKCRRLIAFSHASNRIHARLLQRWRPDLYLDILSKTIVLHPPQKILHHDEARFEDLSVLKIVFVGGDFFRKGGWPMLLALKEIRKSYNIDLTLISDLKIRHNVSRSDEGDVEKVKAFISDNQSWITWHQRLDNEKVLEILGKSHLGMLPSLAETYGYSILEMQAAGVPVVTSNIRAMPENNPLECGWQVMIPYVDGLPDGRPRSEVLDLYESIKNQIYKIVSGLINNPSMLLEYSKFARDKIKREHCPQDFARRLTEIYKNAV